MLPISLWSMEGEETSVAAKSIGSVARALFILEQFAYDKRTWNILELAEKLAMPASTLHRQLQTLVEQGFLQQEEGGKRYQPGNRLISLSYAVMGRHDLRILARDELEKLSNRVGETIHLCQLNGLEMYYVDKVESSHSVSCTSQIGATIPAHAAGAGKVLLAYGSEEKIDNYCSHLHEFPVYTRNTIRDPEKLRAELRHIRERGYAFDNEEKEEGLFCVAAPIWDANGKIFAALSISGPTFRLAGQTDHYIALVRESCLNISRIMGYRPQSAA